MADEQSGAERVAAAAAPGAAAAGAAAGGAEHPDPRLSPWQGFALAADAAVQHLAELVGLDLWLVTAVEQDLQTVVASAGPWAEFAPPGLTFSWQQSFCLRMLERQGPTVAPDIGDVPAYAAVAVGPLAPVKAYVGVGLESDEGEFYGSLCGFAGAPQSDELAGCLDAVQLVGRMLSTILAQEKIARTRAEEADAAQALAERDAVTGLRNRQGWAAALEQEDARCQLYGTTASAVVVALDGPLGGGPDDDHARLLLGAQAVAATARPGDVVAHLGDGHLAVLLVEGGPVAARALITRLRVALRTAGVSAAHGAATRRTGERLHQTVERAAEDARRDDKRRTPRPARPARPGRRR